MLQAIDNPGVDPGPRSQTTLAYGVIRQDILSGRHVPGKKLKIQDLVEELGVSPGAVREALSRLVPEQLVISHDQRGFAVAPLSLADLQDLTDLRCDIEAIALRRSVERGDVDWEARLIAAEHRLRGQSVTTGEPGEPMLNRRWVEDHAAFHAALIGACGSRRLQILHAQLYEQAERYRGASIHNTTVRNVQHEHRALVELALARDADGLITACVDHIRKTTALIIARYEAGAA